VLALVDHDLRLNGVDTVVDLPADLPAIQADRIAIQTGMSGLDLIAELDRRKSARPVIVMNGHTDEQSLQRLGAYPLLGFPEEPFAMTDLKATVERWRSTLDAPTA
jgi:FixJ family two-component response regulator